MTAPTARPAAPPDDEDGKAKVSESQKAAVREAHEELTKEINAVVGCAMFGPEPFRSRDLPGLVERMREMAFELQAALEGAGVYE